MKTHRLIVEPGREDHVARHGVTVDEVEQAVFGAPFIVRVGQERDQLIGQADAGRDRAVIVAPRGGRNVALVTAREATEAERRRNRAHRRR